MSDLFSPENLLQAYGAELISDFPKSVHYNPDTSRLETTLSSQELNSYIDEYRQNEFTCHFYGGRVSEKTGTGYLSRLDESNHLLIYDDGSISKENLLKFIHKTRQTQLKGAILGNSPHLHPNIKAVLEASKVCDPSRSYTPYHRFLKAMQILQLSLQELLAEPNLTAQFISDSLCLLKGIELEEKQTS